VRDATRFVLFVVVPALALVVAIWLLLDWK